MRLTTRQPWSRLQMSVASARLPRLDRRSHLRLLANLRQLRPTITLTTALPILWVVISLLALTARSLGLPVPPLLAGGLAFGAILICPGLLLIHLVLRGRELDLPERFAVAFSLSLGLLAPFAFLVMALHGSLAGFGLMFAAIFVALGTISLVRPREAADDVSSTLRPDRVLFLIFMLLLLVVFSISGVGRMDGDMLTVAAYLREAYQAPYMATENALFGPDVPANPRAAFNAWLLLPTFMAKIATLDPVGFVDENLSAYLAVLACLTMYALMKELSGSRRFALFSSSFYILFFLMNLSSRHGNSPWMLFRRMSADKFMLMALAVPVALIFASRYLKSGKRHYLGLVFLTGLGISLIHPIDYVFLGMSVGPFALLHFLFERNRAAFLRLLALGVVTVSLAIGPLFFAMLAFESRDTYLLPTSFENLPRVVQGPAVVLPFITMDILQIPQPEPTVPTLPEAADPFTVVRFFAQTVRGNIAVFSDDRYIAHPAMLMELGTLLALALTPLLVFRLRRSPLARYLLGLTLACFLLGFVPFITPLVGKAITPWQVYRLVWPLPVVPIIAFFLYGFVDWLARWIGRPGQAVPILTLGLVFAVGWPSIDAYCRSLRAEIAADPLPPTGVAAYLKAHPGAPDEVILAPVNESIAISALTSKPDIIAHRPFNTSEEFPSSRQDEARQRVIDVDAFEKTRYLGGPTIALMQRYPVRWVLLRPDHPLAGQLDHAPAAFTPRYRDPRYVLWEVTGSLDDLKVSAVVAGNDALAGRDWTGAIAAFERALANNPTDILAYHGLGEALLQTGDAERALAQFQRAAELAGDAYTSLALGRAQEEAGDREAARETYRNALDLTPNDWSLHLALGDLLAADMDFAGASEQYEAALALDFARKSDVYYFSLGRLWEGRRVYRLAEEAFAKAVEEAPTALNWRALGIARLRQGKTESAENAFLSGLRLAPWDTTLQRALAEVRLAAADSAGAEQAFRWAIAASMFELDPATRSRVALGQLYQKAGQVEKALAEYKATINLQPYDTVAYWTLGQLQESLGDFEAAEATYRSLIEAAPRSADGHLLLGSLLISRGELAEGRAEIDTAVRTEPTSTVAWIVLGHHLSEQGLIEQAIGANYEALQTNPASVEARIGLAQVLQIHGQMQRALGQLQIAVGERPGSGLTRAALGDAYRRRAEMGLALGEYERAIAVDPNYAGTYLSLGEAYEMLGEPEQAVESYAKAVSVQPEPWELPNATAAFAYLALGQTFYKYDLPSVAIEAGPAVDGLANNQPGSTQSPGLQSLAQALYIKPDLMQAHVALSRAYMKQGQAEEALRQVETAVESTPDSAAAYIALGDTYGEQGQWEKAKEAYHSAIEMDRTDAGAYIALGQVHLALGQPNDALAFFREAIGVDPGAVEAYTATAEALRGIGDLEAAAATAREAVTAAPGSAQANAALGRVYAAMGRFADAEGAFKKAITAEPAALDGYLGLGELEQVRGNPDAAEAAFLRAADVDKGQAQPLIALADLYASQSRHDDAVRTLEEAIRTEPGNVESYLVQGQILRVLGQRSKAVGYLKQAAEVDRSLATPYLELAALYEEEGRYAEAEDALDSARLANPGDAAVPVARATFLRNQGRGEQALMILQVAVERYPGAGEVWAALAEQQARAGQMDDALSTYQRGIAAAPGSSELYVAYGRALLAAGRWDDAFQTLWRATEVAPQDVTSWVALGDAYRSRNRREEALEAYQRAVQMVPSSGEASVALGTAMLQFGRQEEGMQALEQAVKVAPHYAVAFVSLGSACEELGDFAQAESAYREAISRAPADPGAYESLGELYLSYGKTDEALAELRRGVEAAPGVPDSHVALGSALAQLGRYTEAEEAFGQAIRMQAGFLPAQVALAELDISRGKVAEASQAIEKALAVESTNIDLLLMKGRIQQSSQATWADAERTYRLAASLDRTSAAAEIALGDLETQAGVPGEAIAAYERAVEADYFSVEARMALAQALLRFGPADEALAVSQQAVKEFPSVGGVYVALGDTRRHLGELDEALAAYQDGTKAAPSDSVAHVGLARGYLAKGEFDNALQSYESALEAAPTDITARLGAVQVRLTTGDLDGALRVALRALAEHPEAAEVHLSLASVLRAREEWEAAEEAIGRALAIDSSSAATWLAVAAQAQDRNDVERAGSALLMATSLSPGDPSVWEALGNHQLGLGQMAGAKGSFGKAVELAPGQAAGYVGLSKAYAADQRWNEALAEADIAIATQPGDGAAHTAKAQALQSLGRLAEAELSYRAAIGVEPAYAEAYLGLGDLLVERAELGGAIDAYRRYSVLDVSGSAGFARLGQLYLRIGPAEAALAEFKNALLREPDSASALVGLGDTYRHLGRPEDALASYKAAAGAQPARPEGYVALAGQQTGAGDFVGALGSYRQALAVDPGNTEALAGRATLMARLGNGDAAVATLREAVAKQPREPGLQVTLGDLLVGQGQYSAAEEAFEEALRLDGQATGAYLGLARIRLAQERTGAARDLYLKATEVDPADPAVWLAWSEFLSDQAEWTAADAAAAKATSLAPTRADGYVARAQNAQRQGKVAEAKTQVLQAVAVEPGSPSAQLTLGNLSIASDPSAADMAYRNALRLQPGFAPAYLALGDFLLLNEDVEGAIRAYRAHSTAEPSSIEGRLRIAEAYLELDRDGEARATLQELSGLASAQTASANEAIADLYTRMDSPLEAITALRKAISLDPGRIETRSALVSALVEAGQTGTALVEAQEAVRLHPSEGAAHLALGSAYDAQGNDDKAREAYRRATEVEPSYADAYFARAQFEARSRRMEGQREAIALYEQGLALDPTSESAYAGLAGLYRRDESLGQAVERYTYLEQAEPSLVWPKMALGQMYATWSHDAEALEAYDRAQQVAPEYAFLYCRRGVLAESLWRYDEARDHLGTCLPGAAPSPENEEARAAMARIIRNARQVRITAPASGASVTGTVPILGTAAGTAFSSYQLEYRRADLAEDWRPIADRASRAVQGDVLGIWNTDQVSAGEYVLRLTVWDSTGNHQRPAEVTVRVP